MSQAKSSAVAARELTITRIFRAPRELVFRTWTDPEHLAEWWGPAGFTNPRCEADVRPGGAIRIDMRAPNGTVYPMGGEFREIVPPEKLVFLTSALDSAGKSIFENLNTVLFEEFEGDKTLIKLHVQVVEEKGEAEQYLKGMEQGWSMSLDRLDEYVAAQIGGTIGGTGHSSQASAGSGAAGPAGVSNAGVPDADVSDREILAWRIFRAPRELVWRMWTEAEHIQQWWGPRGFTATIHQMDVRPGGEWRFILHGPDGTDYENHKVFEEIVPLERLVMNHLSWPHHRMYVRFADAPGGTEVAVRMLFENAADRAKLVTEVGADKKLVENLDRLQEHIDSL